MLIYYDVIIDGPHICGLVLRESRGIPAGEFMTQITARMPVKKLMHICTILSFALAPMLKTIWEFSKWNFSSRSLSVGGLTPRCQNAKARRGLTLLPKNTGRGWLFHPSSRTRHHDSDTRHTLKRRDTTRMSLLIGQHTQANCLLAACRPVCPGHHHKTT